jgi:hypothetical protein
MENIFYKEWQNQNELRSFPFIDPYNIIPPEIFVDLSISCFGNVDVFLSSIYLSEKNINGKFLDSSNNLYKFNKDIVKTDTKIKIYNKYNRNVGSIVLGKNFYSILLKTKKVQMPQIAGGGIKVYPSCVFLINSSQAEFISINGAAQSGIFNFIESPEVKIDGTGSDIIFNVSGSSSDDECCTLIDKNTNQPITILKRLNLISPNNGKVLIKVRDSGQPINVLQDRQILRINSIPNGIQIGVAN